MKAMLFIFLLIPAIGFSQETKRYISISPKKIEPSSKSYYQNIYAFDISVKDYFLYDNCSISFYALDNEGSSVESDNVVRCYTGWDYEFQQAETNADSLGYVEFKISTDNFPRVFIAIAFNGYDRKIYMRDVEILLHGKKF